MKILMTQRQRKTDRDTERNKKGVRFDNAKAGGVGGGGGGRRHRDWLRKVRKKKHRLECRWNKDGKHRHY